MTVDVPPREKTGALSLIAGQYNNALFYGIIISQSELKIKKNPYFILDTASKSGS